MSKKKTAKEILEEAKKKSASVTSKTPLKTISVDQKLTFPTVSTVIPTGIAGGKTPLAVKGSVPKVLTTATPAKQTATVLPTVSSATLPYADAVRKYFQQGLAFAQQGPQSRQQIADELLGFDIGDYDRGDISNLSMEILSQLGQRNAYYINQHRDQGTFDEPQFLTGEYISLPSKGFLDTQYPLIGAELEKSRQKDEEAKIFESNLQSTRGAWEQLEMEKNNPYMFDPMYGYAMMEYLQGSREEPFNFDQWDYDYQNLPAAEQQERLAKLQEQWNALDFDTLTGRNYKPYQSQTPELEAQYNLIGKEIDKREAADKQSAMLRSHPSYGTPYVAPESKTFPMPSVDQNGNWTFGTYDSNMYDELYLMHSGLSYADLYTAAQNNPKVKWFLDEGLNYMLPEEIAEYKVAKEIGDEEATAWLRNNRSKFLLRRAMVMEEWTKTKAGNSWLAIPSYIDARINNLANVLNVPRQVAEAWLGIDDPNSPAFDQMNKNAWVGEEHLDIINDMEVWEPLKKAVGYVYQGTTSAVDNFARLAASGFNPTASLIIAGLQSGSASLHESADRDDVSGAAKIVKAIGTGAIEVGTEKIGLDAFFDKGQKNAVNYIKQVFLSELGEEELNALSEPVLEAVVAFLFDHEAEIKSGPEFWQELTDTAITTAISSLLMGGGGAITQSVDNRQTGKAIQQQGDPEAMLEIAKSMPKDNEAYAIAMDIEGTVGKGKKLPLGKLGKLTQAIGQNLSEEYKGTVDRVMEDAITERLVELGTDSSKARKNAPVIRKLTQGEKLTAAERAAVAWDDNADQVTREISRDMAQDKVRVEGAAPAAPEGQRTGQKWVTDMRIRQVEATGENTGKAIRYRQAMERPVTKAAKEAAKAGEAKVNRGKTGKPAGKPTAKKVYFDDGTSKGEGDILRFEESEDGKLQMVLKADTDGKGEVKVDIGNFTEADGTGTAGLIEAIKDIDENLHKVTAEEASAMLNTYNVDGGDVGQFVENYERAYLAGFSGADGSTVGITGLDPKLAEIAYDAGKRQSEKEEERRFEMAKGRTRNENVSIGWIGEVDSDSQITGRGDPDALATAMESMTEEQRNAVNFISELCREFGANAVLYASKPGSNVSQSGRYDYDAHSDTFFFDINAGATTDLAYARQIKNGTLGAALPKFVGHEFTHFMQINSAEGYANYARAVKNALNERGQDVAVLMRDRIDQALANGRKLTLQEAEFEVIAHASEYMLQDSKFTDSMDDSMKGRFRQFIKEFGQKIRNAFAKLTGGTVESRALREQIDGVYHYVNDLQKLWDVGMTEAGNRPMRGDAAAAGSEANSLFALKDSAGNDISVTEEEIKSNKEYVANMPPIVSLNGNPFAKNPDKDFKTMAHEYLGDDGIMAYNDRLGQINIGMDGIEHLIGSLTNRRSAMIPAIKDVVENGRIIEYEHPHKGYWYDTAVIAGVISLDGVQYYMGVAVRENDDSSTGYYVHDAVFVEKNKSPLPNKSGLVTAGEKAPTLAIILSELANYNSKFAENSEKSGMRFESDALGIAEDLENPDGSSLFSLRSMQEDYDTYRQMLADNGVSTEEIDALFETIDETMRIVESEREILDFGWNVGRDQRSFNPVKQNSDPLYKVSLDFSSLCRKRLLQQTVQERLEAKYDTVLTKAERVAIRNELMLLREEGKQIEVACALCYVESARLKSPAQIQRFFDDRRAVMVDYFAKKNKEYMQGVNAKADELIVKFGNKPGTKKGELNSFQKKAVENLKQSMYKTYTPSAEEESIIKTALDLPGESFRSADGLWKLKKEHEEIFDAYTSFVRNATKSKGIEGDEAWWAGDSQNISDKLIAKMNAENGLRSQSWSDFQVIHLLDYMAAVIELSTRNAKMQTYTKVPDFVKLMGDTGSMINLSLIPKGFDGTLNYDPIEGMPIEDALALRRDFPDAAGTICIGITDKHIRLLLANDDIDYVIPYHASSLDKKTRQQMGMKVWEDFTNYQNEKQRDYSNTVKDTKTYHKKPSFSEWFDYDTVAARAREVGANMAMQEAAERYIDLCHRRGLQEKFAQFANEPNYWKLLIDRKMINQVTGEIIQQKAVQPRFDLDRIKGILQGEVDRFKAQNQDFNEAVSHIEQKWENGDIRKAAKSKKVQDAVKAFEDTVIVRNIIESAAEMEQPKSLYAPREVDELTTRDYLAESGLEMAETVEERNALTIYQERLKAHAEASDAVFAAEQATFGKEGQELADARAELAKARKHQKDLYNRLLKVENTEHVKKVVERTQRFINEELHGKTKKQLETIVADREQKILELRAELNGLKEAAKNQRAFDRNETEEIYKERIDKINERNEKKAHEAHVKMVSERVERHNDYEARLHKADVRSRQKIESLKTRDMVRLENTIAKYEREIARLNNKATAMFLENNMKYLNRIADIRERRDLNLEIRKKERHLKGTVKALSDLILRETDYKNVKDPIKPAVHALVKAFVDDFGNLVFYNPSDEAVAGGKTSALEAREKFERLKMTYDKLANIDGEEAMVYDPEVSAWLAELHTLAESYDTLATISESKTRLKTKLYIYERLSGIADSIAFMVKTADQIFVNGRRQQIANVAGDVADTLSEKADKKEFTGKLGEAVNVLDDSLLKGNMTAVTFFESLGNSGLKYLYDDITEAERVSAARVKDARDFIADLMKKHGYLSWNNMRKPVSFVTEQGREVYMTTGNMLWAYAVAKRELSNPLTATHHLSEGGFAYDEKTKRTKEVNNSQWKNDHNKLSAKDIVTIEHMLTEDQKAFADACIEYLSTECADWGNEASLALFGIKKYNEEYYFPFQVDGDQLYKNSAAGSASTTDDARLKHLSFTHRVTSNANKPLIMGDFLDIVDNHINQMAIYSAFVLPIENLNRVLNSKVEYNDEEVTIRSLIARKHGKAAQKYLNDFLKDMNGGPQTDKRGEMNAFIRLFKKNAVMGKLQVALQQFSSIARAFVYINPKYFMNIPKELPYTTWERMMQYSGTTVYKDMGGFNIGLGKQAADWIGKGALEEYNYWERGKFLLDQKGVAAMKDNWVDFLTALPGVVDKMTWAMIWTATENEQADIHPGMDRNSVEFLEMVGERFDDIVRHSQVYDSVLAKSQNMRSKSGLAKMITAFMAEPTLTMNMLYSAVRSKDKKVIARTVSSLVLNAVLGALGYAAIAAWDKDDDERTATEKFVTKFSGKLADSINPLTMIPFVSDFWSLISGYDVERTDMAVFADLYKYGANFIGKLSEGKEITFRDYENFLGTAVLTATGVPIKNLMGDFRKLVLNLPGTDFSAPPASRVKYGVLDEVVFGRDASNTAYYERLLAATMDGDKQEMYDLKDYLMATKGVKEDAVRNGVVNAYKKEYQRGGITKKEAADFLYNNDLVNGATADKKRQAAFKKVDEWDEGSEDYSVYNTIFDAVKNGNSAGITNGIKELTNNGYVESDVVSGVRTLIRESYMEGTMSQSQVKAAYKSRFAPKNFDVNDQNDWYWLFKELDWGKKNGNSTDGYSNYIFLKDGFTKYNESTIRNAWNELTSHGYEDDDVKSYVRTYILKPMVQEGKITTSRATELLNRWASYKKNSDNIDKPQEWLNSK